MREDFLARGFARFPGDPAVRDWLSHATGPALATVEDRALRRDWLRAGGTWFVGVNALDNDERGRVAGGPPLGGAAMDFVAALGLGELPLDRAQVSVTWPGYPRRGAGESEAAFRFRQRRDAAHVDGIKARGAHRRRHIGECHAYLLGLPLTDCGPGASPLVVWKGSHAVMRAALLAALGDSAPADWGEVDITEAYAAARREVFARCERIELHARPGEAYLLHRLALHGVAPWREGAAAPPEGRAIAYFRPDAGTSVAEWLSAP